MRFQDESVSGDEAFGPGTDLVVSLLAALFLLIPLAVQAVRLSMYLNLAQVAPPQTPVECPQESRLQIWEFRESYRDEPLFEKNRAGLTEAAKHQIQAQWETLQGALESGLYNQLLIEGHASPETSSTDTRLQRERWNLQLSLGRAMAVADYLYELGIPYECISITGFGRSHSVTLNQWLQEYPGRTLQNWDDGGRTLSEQVGESALASERLVRVFGIHHDRSLCNLIQGKLTAK